MICECVLMLTSREGRKGRRTNTHIFAAGVRDFLLLPSTRQHRSIVDSSEVNYFPACAIHPEELVPTFSAREIDLCSSS